MVFISLRVGGVHIAANQDRTAGAASRGIELLWRGRSQAVRLPAKFHFEGNAVTIRREGDAVILEPVRKPGWPEGYWEWVRRHRDELELGEIQPLGGALLDVDLDLDDE
jgi:virulence-associated protein VagC